MTPDQRFDHLARTVGPDVLAYLARRTDPREDAADVFQQVLLITWRRLRVVPLDDRAAFGWMLGTARKCLANHRRAGVRRSALADRLREQVLVATTGPEVDVSDLLATLSSDDAELVTLVHWEGLTLAEAGAVLGLSPAAARKRMERARARLRNSRLGGPELPTRGTESPNSTRSGQVATS